jgi:ATP-dependent Clp protease adaptor protein ClpS
MATATATETKIAPKLKEVKMWRVKLLNDDYTPFDFVIEVLCQLYGKDVESASIVATDIHHKGSGTAGIYTKEIAMQKAKDTIQISRNNGHPLMAKAEEMA